MTPLRCYTYSVTLGIISDVHANVLALEAVLKVLRAEGANTILCLGDLVGYGPSPNETIDLVRAEGLLCALGAADERIAFEFAGTNKPREGVADEILEWTRTVIEPRHVEFLRSLPVQSRLTTPVGRLRFFHGSPQQPSERLTLNRDVLELVKVLEANRCNILACGGSHVPYYQELPNGWVVNPGSVGLSLNGEPGADYALLKISKSGVEVAMDKVEYDFAAVAFDIVAWGLPAMVAETIQRGRMPEKLS